MKYIVDTSVWSQALRREHRKETEEVYKLNTLLNEGERVYLLGVILQEILQGVKHSEQFKKIKEALSFFPIIEATCEDHIHAAELYNHCRSKGIQASTIDFLISAIAIRNECHLLTADRDFQHIAKHTKLKLL